MGRSTGSLRLRGGWRERSASGCSRRDLAFSIETGIACAAYLLLGLTAAQPRWIETALHVDPDRGSGSLEWAIAIALLFVAATSGMAVARDRRRRLERKRRTSASC
jgi:hypothetical protein